MSDEQRMVLRTEDLVKKYRTRTVVNLVSINVDKLVKEGYLKREANEGDRRKTKLV